MIQEYINENTSIFANVYTHFSNVKYEKIHFKHLENHK